MDKKQELRLEAEWRAASITDGATSHLKTNLLQLVYMFTDLGELTCARCALDRLDFYARFRRNPNIPSGCIYAQQHSGTVSQGSTQFTCLRKS